MNLESDSDLPSAAPMSEPSPTKLEGRWSQVRDHSSELWIFSDKPGRGLWIYSPNRFTLGSILEKNTLDKVVGALGLVGRGLALLGALGWVVLGALACAGWIGCGVGRAGRASWVGRVGRAGWVGRGVGRGVWPCWARWAGLGVGFGHAGHAGRGGCGGQSRKIYYRSNKLYSRSTKVHFQITQSILSKYTSILWKYKSILS